MTEATFDSIAQRLALHDLRGLEIGALYNPRLRKEDCDISYLDHASAEGLLDKYAGNPFVSANAQRVVDVDFVLQPGQTLLECVRDASPFDFVVAAHVIEHVPNPYGWLQEVASVLTDQGRLVLVVPDKRYCFDAKRTATTAAQLVDAYLRDVAGPTAQQMFDHHSLFLGDVDTASLWNGLSVDDIERRDVEEPVLFALDKAVRAERYGEYEDIHCSTFTPMSFLEVLEVARRMEILPFRVDEFHPTLPGSAEFTTVLRHSSDGDEKRGSLESAQARTRAAERAVGEWFRVSGRERRVIELKRSLVNSLLMTRRSKRR